MALERAQKVRRDASDACTRLGAVYSAGKPIERQAWYFNDKLDLGDDLVLQLQHMSM
ncbi:MAG: hypothetical protein WB689_39520 [Xanthobacteraceae bacterium]